MTSDILHITSLFCNHTFKLVLFQTLTQFTLQVLEIDSLSSKFCSAPNKLFRLCFVVEWNSPSVLRRMQRIHLRLSFLCSGCRMNEIVFKLSNAEAWSGVSMLNFSFVIWLEDILVSTNTCLVFLSARKFVIIESL